MTDDNTGNSVLPIPDLTSTFPGPFPVNPHADQVEERTLNWLNEFPLSVEADRLRLLCNITSQGVARAVPGADRDSLVLCAELFVWLTLFDDVHGEVTAVRDPDLLSQHVVELTGVLSGHPASNSASPFAAALHDLLERLQARATPDQYLRLTQHLRGNLSGIVRETQQMITPERMTVYDYCAMRPDTSFVRTIMTTAEILLAYELSDELRTSRLVYELEAAVTNLAGWINDLASCKRDAAHLRAAPFSLPTLLMAEHGIAFPVAFQLVSRMCEDQAGIARTRMTELSASGFSPLTLHSQALEHITRSFIWQSGHARYRP